MKACRVTGLDVGGVPIIRFFYVAKCDVMEAIDTINHTPGVANLVCDEEMKFSSKEGFIMPLPMVLARAVWREADEAGLPF